MKPCRKCGATDRYKSGQCRPCSIAYAAAWKKANPEKRKAYNALYRASNPEKGRAAAIKWWKLNPEKKMAINKRYCQNNPETVNAKVRRWSKANPAYVCEQANKKRALKLKATPAWANVFFIKEIYDLAQRRNKATGFKWHVDHIVPLQSSIVCGLHVEHNLSVIPAKHNISKSNKFWPDMP